MMFPGKRRFIVSRVENGDHRPVGKVTLRKVSLTLEGGGHSVLRESAWYATLQHLNIVETEKLVFLRVPVFWDVNRSAEREALGVIAVFRTLHVIPVVEEIVGIEIVVPHVPVAGAVIFGAAGFAHYLDDGAAIARVFGLVRIQNDLDFAYGVH